MQTPDPLKKRQPGAGGNRSNNGGQQAKGPPAGSSPARAGAATGHTGKLRLTAPDSLPRNLMLVP
eukprot:1425144-Rhodomonas_salina.1